MFGLGEEAAGPVGPAAPWPDALLRLGEDLPRTVRLGTSSWSFPGWEGLVYDRRASASVLARHGLGAYAAHPLFRAVGVDRSYYAPPAVEVFADYAAAVPDDFRFLVKAHGEVTSPSSRGRAGSNPRFLDADYAAEEVVGPARAGLGEKLAAILFQFPSHTGAACGGARPFRRRLEGFLERLPAGGPYAFEVRAANLLGPPLAAVVEGVGGIPCLSVHPSLPGLGEQRAAWGDAFARAPLVLARWMLGPGLEYRAAVERYRPFDALIDVDPHARAGLAELLLAEGARPALVLVNNKAEGSAPRSVEALAEALCRRKGTG
ncbi:MAG: DUF72 domain-containing protein [Planctomycetota bacterium]|nr:MAG: DUF72 domain-containing protein [Planctomycetota bacterium]